MTPALMKVIRKADPFPAVREMFFFFSVVVVEMVMCQVLPSDLFGCFKWSFQGLSDLHLGYQRVTRKKLVVLICDNEINADSRKNTLVFFQKPLKKTFFWLHVLFVDLAIFTSPPKKQITLSISTRQVVRPQKHT